MKIIVETQEQKDRLIAESEYIHDFGDYFNEGDNNGDEFWFGLDSDKAGTLMHIYMNPDMIEVLKK